ncbi:hypothetical protein [Spiribacter roseus]|uniref:hypothetical protein n=1 Tax=Spiribacter roseus TaxID=1855875 RepID=UPI0012FD2E9B
MALSNKGIQLGLNPGERLRDRFCTVDPHISLADSLIADRRAEVAREEASP